MIPMHIHDNTVLPIHIVRSLHSWESSIWLVGGLRDSWCTDFIVDLLCISSIELLMSGAVLIMAPLFNIRGQPSAVALPACVNSSFNCVNLPLFILAEVFAIFTVTFSIFSVYCKCILARQLSVFFHCATAVLVSLHSLLTFSSNRSLGYI